MFSHSLHKVVVDTGPLFSVLNLLFIRQFPARRQVILNKHKLLPSLRDPVKEHSFLDLFANIKTILITSHVVGEIQGHQSLKEEILGDFWRFTQTVMTQKRLNEKPLLLLDLLLESEWQEVVCRLGPTDAGLIKLAEQEKCVLLTDDGPLLSYAAARGVIGYKVEELLRS